MREWLYSYVLKRHAMQQGGAKNCKIISHCQVEKIPRYFCAQLCQMRADFQNLVTILDSTLNTQ